MSLYILRNDLMSCIDITGIRLYVDELTVSMKSLP